ncbi:hypothetical protein [Chitinophaga sp. S165]|uniref:hypothetical protein n=1 Tax=Chitinophaga sp. S165 TaxID=2135462 RepID=UPI000D71794B|nr:hypothetical protein [Chitinophaga sp. S165]PWV46557.1 hypothetical protein C7475_110117 [Chitinophaga sp. S165]
MSRPINHRILIIAACVLWCISLVAEFIGISTYTWTGVIAAPVLLFVGIVYWARNYKAKKGHYPRGESLWKNMTTLGGSVSLRPAYLKEKFPEFVTFWFAFLMLMTLAGYLVFSRSDAFKATQAYCEANQTVLEKTGKIKRYGVFVTGSISTYSARISFSIFGEKGYFEGMANLVNYDGSWKVESVKF